MSAVDASGEVTGIVSSELLIGGDAPPGWRPLADQLASALSAATDSDSPLSARIMAQPWIHAAAETRWIAFVDRPATWLVHGLLQPPGADPLAHRPQRVLADWRRAATDLLEQVQVAPDRCLLFDTTEALQHPDAVAAVLAGWLGRDLALPSLPAPAVPDALAHQLAEAVVAADPRLVQLADELEAACQPLPNSTTCASPSAPVHPMGALERLQDLLRAAEDIHKLQQERGDWLARIRDLERVAFQQQQEFDLVRDQLATAERLLQQQKAEAAAVGADAHVARAESVALKNRSDLLTEQLAVLSEELDRSWGDNQTRRREFEAQSKQAIEVGARAEEQLRVLRAEHQQGQAELASSRRHLAHLEEQLTEAKALQQKLRDQASEQEQKSQRSLVAAEAHWHAQLQALSGQLASEQQLRRTAEATRDETSARLRQSLQRVDALRQQVESAQEQSRQHQQALTAAQASWRDQLQSLARDASHQQELLRRAESARDEASSRLRQALERTERLQLQFNDTEASTRRSEAELSKVFDAPAKVDAVQFLSVRDQAPHRELVIELRGVALPAGTLQTMALKLVEHEGHPGLAVLGSPAGTAPLMRWQPNQRENHRDLLLLVPSDAAGQQRLAELGASDWLAVRRLVALVRAAVIEAGSALPARWRDVASRLQAQLVALPPRLRQDAMELQLSPEPAGALDVTLWGATHGDRMLGPVQFRWSRTGPSPALTLRSDGTRGISPPLGFWPVAEDGRLAPNFALPVGPGVGTSRALRWWAQLAPADASFVLDLIDRLPEIALQLQEMQHGSSLPGAIENWAAAARTLRRHVGRQAGAAQLSQRLRRWRRDRSHS